MKVYCIRRTLTLFVFITSCNYFEKMDGGKELIGRLERCVMLCRGVFEEFGTQPLTDSKSEVLQVCECIEDIFRYRIK